MSDEQMSAEPLPENQHQQFGAEDDYGEEDDEVVAEFDICLAGSLRDQLQLLQYPLRPCYRQYGDHGELKRVEVAVETRADEKAAPSGNGLSANDENKKKYLKEDTSLKMTYQLQLDS